MMNESRLVSRNQKGYTLSETDHSDPLIVGSGAGYARRIRSRGRSGMKKESPKVISTKHAPQFPERKEGQEGAKHDDHTSEQLVDAYVTKCSGEFFLMDKVPDHLLKDVESKRQRAKHKRFPNS